MNNMNMKQVVASQYFPEMILQMISENEEGECIELQYSKKS